MAKKKVSGKVTTQEPKRKYERKLPTATELNQQLQILTAEKIVHEDKAKEFYDKTVTQEKEIAALKEALRNIEDPNAAELTLVNAKVTKLETALEKAIKAAQAGVKKAGVATKTTEEYKDRNAKLSKRISDFNSGDFWHRFVTEGGHV